MVCNRLWTKEAYSIVNIKRTISKTNVYLNNIMLEQTRNAAAPSTFSGITSLCQNLNTTKRLTYLRSARSAVVGFLIEKSG